jgi:predicted kinase
MSALLIVIGGLPGTGKTSLARALARALDAVHVRIDVIEQAVREATNCGNAVGAAGYVVGYAVAGDNLRLGRIVIADCVNPLPMTRAAWRNVAERAGVSLVEIEAICSDPVEHRRRIESRRSDIPGSKLPGWQDVIHREYAPWASEHVVIDTAHRSLEQSVTELHALLLRRQGTLR